MEPGKLYIVDFNSKANLQFSVYVDGRVYIDYPSGTHFLCLSYSIDDVKWQVANVLLADGIKGELLFMTDTRLDKAIKPLKKNVCSK